MAVINTNGNLWIFSLNVGQGDTTIMVTPERKVVIIDARSPDKVEALLTQLGLTANDPIEHVIISHPHSDHYSAVQRLLTIYKIQAMTLSSLWRYETSLPGYDNIFNQITSQNIPVNFLSGHMQMYPDDYPTSDPDAPNIELLGPSNQMIETLYEAKSWSYGLESSGEINPNHRSIIARVNWKSFRMIIAGDAQMENWAHFDLEQMLDISCSIYRAAHHGSVRGTQYERLERFRARYVIVSSDHTYNHHLPDYIGCAAFLKYSDYSLNQTTKPVVSLTKDTGTIKIVVQPSGSYHVYNFGEHRNTDVPALGNETLLTRPSNPTKWRNILDHQLP